MDKLISTLKEEDGRIASTLKHIVSVPHGGGYSGPMSYDHRKDPELLEKVSYGAILTDTTPQPVVQVTDEDVAIMDQKAWMAKIMDFNNWVGQTFRPQENPANKELLSRIYPEWIEMQKKEIEDYHDMKKRIETIKLMGAQNVEDMFLLYRMQWPARNGAQITDDTLTTSLTTANAPGLSTAVQLDADKQAVFRRGIWNSRRLHLTGQALAGNVLDRTAQNAIGTTMNPLALSRSLTAGWAIGE